MTIVTTNVFLAISDPTRRAVLDLLATGSRKAGDIAARFRHLTQPAVSRHLKVLREAGLVNVEVHAQQRIYELKPEGLAELYEWEEAMASRIFRMDTESPREKRAAV